MINDIDKLNTVFPQNPFWNFLIYLPIKFKITELTPSFSIDGKPDFNENFINTAVGDEGEAEIQAVLKENLLLETRFGDLHHAPTIRKIIGRTFFIPSLKSLSIYSIFKVHKTSDKKNPLKIKLNSPFNKSFNKTVPVDLKEDITTQLQTKLQESVIMPSGNELILLIQQSQEFNTNKTMKDITQSIDTLNMLAKYGNAAIMKSFLKDNYLKTLLNYLNTTLCYNPLHYACRYNSVEVLKVLLENDPDFSKNLNKQFDSLSFTQFLFACKDNTAEVVDFLLKNGGDMTMSLSNRNVLHFASKNQHEEVITLLLKNGAKKFLNLFPSPLISAVRHLGAVHLPTIYKLIDAGAQLSDKDEKKFMSESIEILFYLALREIKKGNFDEAQKYLKKAKNLDASFLKILIKNALLPKNEFRFTTQQQQGLQEIITNHIKSKCLVM